MIALFLQQQQPQGTSGLSDLELAQQLQQEEYQQQQGGQPVPARAPSPQVCLLLPAPSSRVPPLIVQVARHCYSCDAIPATSLGLFCLSLSPRSLPSFLSPAAPPDLDQLPPRTSVLVLSQGRQVTNC